MTLLHQAAQKAVEALTGARAWLNCERTVVTMRDIDAAIAAVQSALQHHEEPSTAVIPPAPPECETKDEKTAFSFGYWQGLHAARKGQKEPREPVAPADNWQSIKSAPRDGTNIMLRFGVDGVSQGKYVPGIAHPWKFIDTNDGITWLVNHAVDGPGGPSHWQPMPSAIRATSPSTTRQQEVGSFQQRVEPWLLTCFGEAIAADHIERNHRFLEESLELVQACGCTVSEAHQLVDYVYGRPVGEKRQEAGGVMVTLAALCRAQAIDMHAEGERELARIWTMVEKIRAKQAAKPKHSPLPEVSAPSTPEKAGGVPDTSGDER